MSVIAGTLTVAIILVSMWFLVGIVREWLLMRQHRQMRQRRAGGDDRDHE